MKINPGKSKAIRFTTAPFKNLLGYCLGDQKIPEASNCKYLGIILCSDLNWVDQVNYKAQKTWKALHFVMRVLKKGNRNTRSLAYTSLVRPFIEYVSACWDPCREGKINALDRVQNHHHHHHISVMELGHLLNRSSPTYPEVSSKVCHDFFCHTYIHTYIISVGP